MITTIFDCQRHGREFTHQADGKEATDQRFTI
ncbi:MAG: Transcriptional regulator [Pseudomonas shahriarae]|nr:Uncharacterised protein [Pseudomonas fluorescens]